MVSSFVCDVPLWFFAVGLSAVGSPRQNRICMTLTNRMYKAHILTMVMYRYIRAAALVLFSLAMCSPLWSQDTTLELDPANSKVEFTLADVLHTVRGTFALRSGTIHFNPATGQASGLVVVDVKSGQSGNHTRDRKMHAEILNSDKYPDATFTPTKMSGAFAPQGASTIQLEGTFRIHGGDHSVTWSIPIQVSNDTISAKIHTVLPYVDWGMKNPSTFILRVSDKVDLDISATGRLTTSQAH